ncbi:biotin--[acetyl-CoA-carboxylase] ligase [Limnothrix redekei]|uniref:Biotin--[acetyl-CoA-carboxylase] ligase n=1 Tax=Limnothrix redekei LRLZ20PSL1 TaxID=3112953 RepID=A0ABW7C605_9CYAN
MLKPTPIDPAEFSAAVLRETARLGVRLPRLQVLAETGSTNQVAWELAQAGAQPGTIVIALQQSAGRGQWGRQWSSPLGGLYLSRYFAPQLLPEDGAQLTLAAAWGLGQTLRDRGVPVALKWPNDLVVRGRKWGGLLTETRLVGGKIARAVTGLGLNWANPVPETGINATELFSKLEFPELGSPERLHDQSDQSSDQLVDRPGLLDPSSHLDPLGHWADRSSNSSKISDGSNSLHGASALANQASQLPPPPLLPPTDFPAEGGPPIRSLAELAALAIAGLDRGDRQLQTGGIESFLADYLELLETCGRSVQVGDRTGIAVGITSRGELRVKFSDQLAAELHLSPGAVRLGYARSPQSPESPGPDGGQVTGFLKNP